METLTYIRQEKSLFFVVMNMTEKFPTFGAIFHLHFQVFKNIKKQPQWIFAF